MTNRLLAGAAFAALVISVLSLFVALSAAEVQPARTTTDVADVTTTSDADDEAATSPLPATTAGAAADPATPSPTVVTATTAVPTEPAATSTPDAMLPGTPATFWPAAGTQLGVVGVAHDDWLNVRHVPNGEVVATLTLRLSIGEAGPGESTIIVRDATNETTLATLGAVGVTATGHTRDLATSTWHEIQAGPITGWASSNYLAPLSPASQFDITERVERGIGSSPTAASLTELANSVAGVFVSDAYASRVRIVAPPGAWEGIADVAVDVVGQLNNSVRGYRLVIWARPAGDTWAALTEGDINTDAGPYTLGGVLATPLCYSHLGVNEDGTCD